MWTFKKAWNVFIGILWIFPNNFIPLLYNSALAIIFAMLDKIFQNPDYNLKEISDLFIELAKLNTCPKWTKIVENKHRAKHFNQFLRYIYIISSGLLSFLYHLFAAIILYASCIFILTAAISLPFGNIHLQLAFIQLYPFKYNFETTIPFFESEEEEYKISSSYSSRSPSPRKIE